MTSTQNTSVQNTSVRTDKLLQTLRDLARSADSFRKIAFTKAIASIQSSQSSQSSCETITRKELLSIPGIGDGILRRFDELVLSGQLVELKEREEELKVIEIFEGIYGVGPVLAKKWYQQGYKTLDDIPVESLTYAQALGLKYYKEINSRIPRSEIDGLNRELTRIVSTFNAAHRLNVRAKICGSYLRGRESSGDVDIIISERFNREFIDTFLLESTELFQYILAKGPTKVLTLGGMNGVKRRIDLELVENDDWAYALLYFTGSANFNKHMRGIAKDKGYLLNQSGLYFGKSKIVVDDEKDIFEFLDMKYLTPLERDSY